MTCSDALLMLDSTPQTADSRHTQVGGPAPCHADDRPNARTGRTAKTHTRTVLRHNDVHDRKQRQSPESLGRWHGTADQPFGREAAPGPEACKTWSSGSSVVAGLRGPDQDRGPSGRVTESNPRRGCVRGPSTPSPHHSGYRSC